MGIAKADFAKYISKFNEQAKSGLDGPAEHSMVARGARKIQIDRNENNCRWNLGMWLVVCQRKSLLEGGATVALIWQDIGATSGFFLITTRFSTLRTGYFANLTRTCNKHIIPTCHYTRTATDPTIPTRLDRRVDAWTFSKLSGRSCAAGTSNYSSMEAGVEVWQRSGSYLPGTGSYIIERLVSAR
jgi:hypothetical protein